MRGKASQPARAVVARIRRFNSGREPELLRMKYERMASDPFTFLRGTCHLFYEDWPRRSQLDRAPLVWLCGDLHFENFGSYKGDNRLVYFDVNDFDECILGPCTWDVTRLLTSLRLGARVYGMSESTIRRLCNAFLDAYRIALESGKPRWVERETSQGMVRQLLQGLRSRTQRELLDRWTTRQKGRLRIRTRDSSPTGRRRRKARALDASRQDRARVKGILAELVRGDRRWGPLRIIDTARRVAGTGSLGLERYVALTEGPAMPEGVGLLDIKVARPSALWPHATARQPRWTSAAARIVTVQQRMQAISPALLTAVAYGDESYVVRELQPVDDRLDLEQSKRRIRRLESAASTMGRVTAWAHLRGSAHQGAAGPEDLMAFAGDERWPPRAIAYAASYARRVERDWKAFRDAMRIDR